MKLIEVPAVDFDLAITLNSGQVFHWEKVGAGFCGAIGDCAAYVEQRGNSLRAKVEDGVLRSRRRNKGPARMAGSPTAATAAQVVQSYFALDHPIDEIRES